MPTENVNGRSVLLTNLIKYNLPSGLMQYLVLSTARANYENGGEEGYGRSAGR